MSAPFFAAAACLVPSLGFYAADRGALGFVAMGFVAVAVAFNGFHPGMRNLGKLGRLNCCTSLPPVQEKAVPL